MTLSPILLLAIALLILLGLLFYWLIFISEGAYLGRGAVRRLYDVGASSYDGVKQYDGLSEATMLANPIFSRLEESSGPTATLLDVATGTARLPVALFHLPFYEGELVGLDLSRQMLQQAARKTRDFADRITLIHHPAVPLPFDNEAFDGVACLEALEFMPDRRAALREMVRVLKTGGWLFVSNRTGSDTHFFPGRVDSDQAFERLLAELGLTEIDTRPWQSYYHLVFARKGTAPQTAPSMGWQRAFRCLNCGTSGQMARQGNGMQCAHCAHAMPVADGGVGV
ncbi:MAG: methyltransferase domain-containing protein [Anaerolineales bacterium]|nr:methyltransferase domain-containing protein [Anaerolineales bacterium]MCB9127938.1 methyltransferase domain-containing protein [Ardenticatenales bacterium]MCB9171700.1 methyltransferase domain-containing protein [Ardenticatenales bacterium]